MAESIVKFKTNLRGLDVLRAVYALAMAYGMTQVFAGSRNFITQILSRDGIVFDVKTLVIAFLFLNVTLLGMRFFWVPRNLQDLVIAAKKKDENKDIVENGLKSWMIALHMFIIFLHGAIYYVVCSEFEFIVFAATSNIPLSSSVFVGYILMHILLLLLNAGWIGAIKRQEEGLGGRKAHSERSPGNVWWRNNLICGLLAIALFAIANECPDISCVQRPIYFNRIEPVFPTSPQVVAPIYYFISWLINFFPQLNTQLLPVFCVLTVFLINSGYDLGKAGDFYVQSRDVESEDPKKADAR